jgi:hypothetical protein
MTLHLRSGAGIETYFVGGNNLNHGNGEEMRLSMILCLLALAALVSPAVADEVDDLNTGP